MSWGTQSLLLLKQLYLKQMILTEKRKAKGISRVKYTKVHSAFKIEIL